MKSKENFPISLYGHKTGTEERIWYGKISAHFINWECIESLILGGFFNKFLTKSGEFVRSSEQRKINGNFKSL